jgi:hypothetical protein
MSIYRTMSVDRSDGSDCTDHVVNYGFRWIASGCGSQPSDSYAVQPTTRRPLLRGTSRSR